MTKFLSIPFVRLLEVKQGFGVTGQGSRKIGDLGQLGMVAPTVEGEPKFVENCKACSEIVAAQQTGNIASGMMRIGYL